MPALVVLPAVAVAAAALVYGVVRARGSLRGRCPDRRRPVPVVLSLHVAAGATSPTQGRHRYADAHTGSLSATAVLRELNARAGRA